MKKLGIFGGTFNPIHNGHIHLAIYLHKCLALDEIVVIPANIPPHKKCPDLVPAEDRLEMCRLACQGHPFLTVSDIEIRQKGTSYTYHTLKAIQQQSPDCQLYLIMGSDMFLSFTSWYRYREIMGMAVLCTAPREEGQLPILEQTAMLYQTMGAQIELMEKMQILELSSTEVRQQLMEGQENRGLLDKQVERYILKNGLYQPQNILG